MQSLLVSIIIPVYNGANFLADSIESALGQSYKNTEVIVVNDGSCDDGATENIAMQYSDRIRYFRKKNGGVASALNYGILHMMGDWFSWLSHDDLYHKDKIQKQIDVVASKNLDGAARTVLMTNSSLMNDVGKHIMHPMHKIKGRYSGAELFRKTFNSHGICGCTLLLHRSVFEQNGGFDTGYKYLQDMAYWVHLMVRGYIFISIPDALVRTRVHGKQITAKVPELYKTENLRLGKEVIKILSDCEGVHLALLMSYMHTCCFNGDHELVVAIVKTLKEKNHYSFCVACSVSILQVYGKAYYSAKTVYKALFKKMYRQKSSGKQ